MFFYTCQQCEEWCGFMRVPLDANKCPDLKCAELKGDGIDPSVLSGQFPSNFSRLLWFARVLEDALQPRESCLVWMTDYGVFHSSENEHLYYRFRTSYGDFRHLHDAPGHLCLDYERPEVITLLHLSILFGWDVHVIPVAGYARLFVSHDEWFQIAFSDKEQYEATKRILIEGSVKVD